MPTKTPPRPHPSPLRPEAEDARAKINLFLHVTGRRPDGYHLLDSLAVFAEAGDVLTCAPAASRTVGLAKGGSASEEAFSLTLGGRFGAGLSAAPNNLVLRAATLLREQALASGVPAARLAPEAFHLVKELPVASGIGGGSADAAATLRLLTRRWDLPDALAQKAAPLLGADVPVCLADRSMRMEGIGDCLTPVPSLPTLGMILVNPGVGVSTPEIFARLARSGGAPRRETPVFPSRGWETAEELGRFLDTTANDLQPPAIAQEPIIQTVLDRLETLPGVLLARMSGSGATCFALFATPNDAVQAQTVLAPQANEAGWWHWAGRAGQDRKAGLNQKDVPANGRAGETQE